MIIGLRFSAEALGNLFLHKKKVCAVDGLLSYLPMQMFLRCNCKLVNIDIEFMAFRIAAFHFAFLTGEVFCLRYR